LTALTKGSTLWWAVVSYFCSSDSGNFIATVFFESTKIGPKATFHFTMSEFTSYLLSVLFSEWWMMKKDPK